MLSNLRPISTVQLGLFGGPLHNNIGVDSGQCGFFDNQTFDPPTNCSSEYDDTSTFYGKCCDKTSGDDQAGIIFGGVVSSTGVGDGSYQLLGAADSETAQIIGLRLVYLPDEDIDEYF